MIRPRSIDKANEPRIMTRGDAGLRSESKKGALMTCPATRKTPLRIDAAARSAGG
jgi:hypothetical protein